MLTVKTDCGSVGRLTVKTVEVWGGVGTAAGVWAVVMLAVGSLYCETSVCFDYNYYSRMRLYLSSVGFSGGYSATDATGD